MQPDVCLGGSRGDVCQGCRERGVGDQFKSIIGAGDACVVSDLEANARRPATNAGVPAGGITVLLVGVGGLFAQLQDALNTVWGVKSQAGRSIMGRFKDRFLSLDGKGTDFLLL